ncbi:MULTISPECIES: SoxR reducing system RseC family protein [Microbulbifer]|uniref:SoxR reducing system RseC family protein n=1 Tax=Microbulbifer celer TaxID=435905 RepID=A0ABW3U766_9GAMM|nr:MULTISPECIES: SoxR reducing system RseC family protein [Microbulbifer]UFN58445.1 SoxR reducing system RseC family protein [Microbulbifer celer]
MIEERGRVVAIESDAVWVETVQRSGCHGCAAKSGCGTGLLGDFWSKASQVRVPASQSQVDDVTLHDTVVIGIHENTLAVSALVVYLLPLLALVGGAMVGESLVFNRWPSGEPGAILGAVSGFVLGGLAVRWYGLRNRNNPAMVPQFLRIERQTPCATTLAEQVVTIVSPK